METVKNNKPGSLPVALIALAVLAYALYTIFAPKPPPVPDDTWTQIQNEKVVRIGVDPSSPPFVVDDGTGKLSGIDVSLADALAARWGVKVQWVYTGYDGLYDALKSKQFDLILSALPYNPLKTEDVNFSLAYFNDGPILVVPGDDSTTTGLESLKQGTVSVELGTSGDAVARKFQRRYNLTVRQFTTVQDALRALQRREVSAALVEPLAFFDFQRAEADTGALNWRVVGSPLADDNYVIAVRKDSPTVLYEVNSAITGLRQDGKMVEILKENLPN